MYEIPFEWQTGDVWSRWNRLREGYADRWIFLFENKPDDDIHLIALLKTSDGKSHFQIEAVQPVDFYDVEKICAKIDDLEKKVQDTNKMMP
jgi:hypothetical protein